MTPRLALLSCLLWLACPLCAGVWDRDRPDDQSLPSVLDTISGRYDVLPAGYYRARLDRLQPALTELRAVSLDQPLTSEQMDLVADRLPIIDDAAVARMRLGEYGDAIILLDWKSRLADAIRAERTATAKLHAYRAAANKVACLRERWLNSDNPDPADLRQAAELLNAALKDDPFNADARWALLEIEWLRRGARYEPGADTVFPNMLGLKDASFSGERNEAALARNNLSGCIQNLQRRMSYGGAIDVDLMYSLSLALTLSGRNEEATIAWLRLCDLLDDGVRSRVAGAPATKGLKQLMSVHLGKLGERDAAEQVYRELRDKAENWRESRLKYLNTNLDAGKHPDTSPAFWSSWSLADKGPPQPGRPEDMADPVVSTTLLVGGIGGLLVVLLLLLGFSVFLGRRTAPPPKLDEL
ncbi:MAG: hypothetical protein H6839_07530 [Planctomycetes bacterium]|nr:hypothetical protein [Planctomycetota bacterium]